MLSNNFIFYCTLLLLLSIFHSIRVFSNKLALPIMWPKCCCFSFSTSPFNGHSGLIPFTIDFFELLVVPGALKSLLKHYNSKASVLQHSAFLMIQLSHFYMTTGKTIAFPVWIFVSKVISQLLNTLSRFVKTFLPNSKHLFISWLQSPSTVIWEPNKIKSVTVSPSICHEVMKMPTMTLMF